MDIMEKVKHTTNTSTEGFEEADYVGMIATTCKEVIDKLICGDPGSSAKILKTFVPPEVETIADPVIEKFVSHLNIEQEDTRLR